MAAIRVAGVSGDPCGAVRWTAVQHFSAERSLFMGKTSHDSPYTPQLYVDKLRSGKVKPQLLPLLILSFRDQSALHSIYIYMTEE